MAILDGPWNLRRLVREVTGDIEDPRLSQEEAQEMRDNCIRWCQDVGLLPHHIECPVCRKQLEPTPSSRSSNSVATCIGKRFRCSKRGRGGREHCDIPLANGTWFAGHKLPMEMILQIMYGFCFKYKYQDFHREVARLGTVSFNGTIADWLR